MKLGTDRHIAAKVAVLTAIAVVLSGLYIAAVALGVFPSVKNESDLRASYGIVSEE